MPEQREPGADEPPQDDPQLALMQRLVDMSVQRTELSQQRTYMNAERTLAVWMRTALALMVIGIAVDRFRILLLQNPGTGPDLTMASKWVGDGLVALGVLIALAIGARFRMYASDYRRSHQFPLHHGPIMAPVSALLVALFGLAMLVLLLSSP